jgi:DNA-binding beta-propeller fold protein YncE
MDGDPGGVDGLDGPRSVATSPDGDHVYVASSEDSAVAVFGRDSSTGLLSFVEAVKDTDSGVDGLDGAWPIALSPDGAYVYVGGKAEDAVAVFSRSQVTGELSFEAAIFDGMGGVDGLAGARGVVVSPDGHHVYAVGSSDHAVAVFARNPTTGTLTWSELVKDGVGGVDGLFSARTVAVTPDGDHVYVAASLDDAVAAFESRGPAPREKPPAFITMWGSDGSGQGQFKSPFGVATGSLYVADTQNHRIQKFDESGNFLIEWGSQGSANGSFDLPLDVTADPLGQVFVLDTGNDRVQVFDSDGTYLRQWDGTGAGSVSGQLSNPSSIAVGAASVTYVTDRGNHVIRRFSPTGVVFAEWGSSGRAPGQFVIAEGIAVGPNEEVYVTDYSLTALHHRLQRFDSSGNLIAAWGAGPSSQNGRFNSPGRPGVDRRGNVYVPDTQNDRILKFDKDGNFLVAWGTEGTGDGQFRSPVAVAVDSLGRIFVVDRENERIQVFGGPWLDVFVGEHALPEQTLSLARPALPDGSR